MPKIALCLTLVCLSPLSLAQDTRDLGLGGGVAEFDEDANQRAAEQAEQQHYDQHSVERLPIDEQPLPKADDKNYLPFLLQRVQVYHARGQYPLACKDFDRLSQAGFDLNEKKDMAGRTYLACAQKLAEQKDIDKANQRLKQAKALIGQVPEMNRCLGAIARQQSDSALAKGDLDAAIAAFDRAYALEPDVTDTLKFSANLTYLARKAYKQEDIPKTQQILEAALKYFPNNVEAQELKRQLWLRDNLAMMVGAVALAFFILVGLVILLRRASARKFAKLDPDLLPDVDDDEDSDLS